MTKGWIGAAVGDHGYINGSKVGRVDDGSMGG